MRKQARTYTCSGFTLVEVVMVMMLGGVLIACLMSLYYCVNDSVFSTVQSQENFLILSRLVAEFRQDVRFCDSLPREYQHYDSGPLTLVIRKGPMTKVYTASDGQLKIMTYENGNLEREMSLSEHIRLIRFERAYQEEGATTVRMIVGACEPKRPLGKVGIVSIQATTRMLRP